MDLGRILLERYAPLLAARFGELPDGCDAQGLLHLIASRRSLVKKAGGPDLARASVALLNDFRNGALGRITLETIDQLPGNDA